MANLSCGQLSIQWLQGWRCHHLAVWAAVYGVVSLYLHQVLFLIQKKKGSSKENLTNVGGVLGGNGKGVSHWSEGPRSQTVESCSPNMLDYPTPHVFSALNMETEFYFCVGGTKRGTAMALPLHCCLFQKWNHHLFPSHPLNCAG